MNYEVGDAQSNLSDSSDSPNASVPLIHVFKSFGIKQIE
jgi:hypothetical protein